MKTKYKTSYKNIDERTLEAVRIIIKNNLFKVNSQTRVLLLDSLNRRLSRIYNVNPPEIRVNDYAGDGCYIPNFDIIMLNSRLSLVTYLHEFKHQLQAKKGLKNTEEIARGWSLSVFNQATPTLYQNAVEKGLILHEELIE